MARLLNFGVICLASYAFSLSQKMLALLSTAWTPTSFVVAEPPSKDMQECQRRAQEFRQQLKMGLGNARDAVLYSTPEIPTADGKTFGLQQHFCHAFNGLDCKKSLLFEIDLTTQKLIVKNDTRELKIENLSPEEESPEKTSTGRLRGVNYKNPDKAVGFADTPKGTFTVTFPQTNAYRCSSEFDGEWNGDQVYDGAGRRVKPETREQGLARAEGNRQKQIRARQPAAN